MCSKPAAVARDPSTPVIFQTDAQSPAMRAGLEHLQSTVRGKRRAADQQETRKSAEIHSCRVGTESRRHCFGIVVFADPTFSDLPPEAGERAFRAGQNPVRWRIARGKIRPGLERPR